MIGSRCQLGSYFMLQAFIPHVGFIDDNGFKLKIESNNHKFYAL